MTSPMDDVLRNQLEAQRTAFGRRQQGMAGPGGTPPPAATLPPPVAPPAAPQTGQAPPWMIHAPGEHAPAEHYSYEPLGDGSWRLHPPGLQAPPWGPQASMPRPATHDELRGIGGDMRQQFGHLADPSARPGRRVGQYRQAGLEPPPAPAAPKPPRTDQPDDESQ